MKETRISESKMFMFLGRDYRIARESMKLTQNQLATIIGVNVKTILSYENSWTPLKNINRLAIMQLKHMHDTGISYIEYTLNDEERELWEGPERFIIPKKPKGFRKKSR